MHREVKVNEENHRLRVVDSVFIANALQEMKQLVEVWAYIVSVPCDQISRALLQSGCEMSIAQDAVDQYLSCERKFSESPTDETSRNALVDAFFHLSALICRHLSALPFRHQSLMSIASINSKIETLRTLALKSLEQTAEDEGADSHQRAGLHARNAELNVKLESLRADMRKIEESFQTMESSYINRKRVLEATLNDSRASLLSLRMKLPQIMEPTPRTSFNPSEILEIGTGTIAGDEREQIATEELRKTAGFISEERRLRNLRAKLQSQIADVSSRLTEKLQMADLINNLVKYPLVKLSYRMPTSDVEEERAAVSIQSRIRGLLVQRSRNEPVDKETCDSQSSKRSGKGKGKGKSNGKGRGKNL